MADDKLVVYIAHPRSSEQFAARVLPACPARVVLDGLQSPSATDDGPFLAPAPAGRPYALVLARSGQQFAGDTTMEDLGVVDGDVLEVQQMGQGAHPC